MGLVMQLQVQVQVILLFFILCMLAFVLGSSGFGEPIAAKPYSFIPSTEAQQPVEHGLTTLVPTQQPHESSPPLSSLVQPPDRSFHPVAKPPHESAPVVAETPHYPTLPPVTETARSPLGSPPPPEVLYPEPPVETPPVLPVPPPHESPQKAPTVQLSPVSLPVLSPPSKVSSPAASVPPSLVLPFPLEPQPPSSSPPPTANPPQILTPKAPVEAPPLFTTPPPYESPLPVLSPSSEIPPLQVSPPTASVISNASAPPPLDLPPPQAGDTPHVKLSPPLAVSPSYAPSLLPTAKPPHPSSLPLAANPPLLPVAQPPAALTFVPPPKSQPLNESSLPPQSLPSTALSPPESVPPTALSPPPQSAPINASSPPISSTRPSPVFDSPPSLPPLPTAKPPHPSSLPLAANPPLLPVAQPPAALTFVPPPKSQPLNESSLPPQSLPSTALSPPESVPPTALSPPPQSAPINASSPPISSARPSPVFDSPPSVPPLPTAKPPHPSSLPLAANPPLLPVAQPPVALTFVPPPKSQPLNESSLPPQSLPSTALSPPDSVPPTALSPPPQSAPINASSPPISSTQPSPVFDSPPSVPPLPTAKPPHPSSLPLAANPPLLPVAQPPAALTLVPPPESQPLDKPSLPPQSPPSTALSPPESVPPTASSPPPQSAPINASSPPSSSTQPSPVFNSPPSLPPLPSPSIVSSPPPQVIPPIALTLPPLQNASSPVPSLIPHISPPTQPLPPSSSVSIPSMAPPLVNLPPDLPAPPPLTPQNASSPPPQSTPVNASSPVFPPIPRLLPPISSFSPPLTVPPPMGSAPDLLEPPPPVPQNASSPPPEFFAPPPATPSTPVPQNASSPLPQTAPLHASPPPQLILPPPASSPTSTLPSSPVVSPPTVLPVTSSPPMPSHAVSPLPHLIPPPSFSPPVAEPPQVLSAPPPSKLPGAIPPRAPSPPLFLSPPRAPPPQEKGLHASVSPPPKVPPHTSSAPPPSELSHPSTPPPAVNSTVHALPPHSSQRKVSQGRAPPPLLTSPETSPPPGTSSRASPPFEQVKPESPPPIRQPVEAPKQSASSSRFNASAPSTKPDLGTASPPAPRDRAPEHLSPHKSPHHEPKFDLQNGTAPAPLSSQVIPAVNGSHHSWHHSPGAPKATAPLPSPQGIHKISSAASPIPHAPPPVDSEIPFLTPKVSPTGSTPKNTKKPQSTPLRSLPPPPPNADCGYLTCPEPTTNTPPGAPCGCVWPMQVGMRLSVALYTFFPLVSELAQEIANGEFLKPSQVRIMGGNASIQEPEKTIVLIDLVPLDDKFDNITSHLISDRFWHKQVFINKSIFGDYDILYVRYPGLPPSPPMAPADAAVINSMPYSYGDPTGNKLHPLGVDVTKQGHKRKPNAIIIAVIVLSAVLGVLMCSSLAWLLVSRRTNSRDQPSVTPRAVTSLARSSGPTGLSTGSGHSSPMSLGSSLATYTGSAKTFSGTEIEKATDNFNPSRILGEGGFGLVYSGDLDDNTKIAVKVLKRDDQQGGREFLAEVEMLSRLHHRNLVKLIGICTDERMRCLVYELIPNGSVDSHLHGTDKDIAPLDWASRVKIALGAARGLAYLHEDSSPRVIHRDFKSSNILLENDFTPKVSDFGLARTALDEQNKHISTRVMGTFGYVAPEYAMTGHLLVKSDVYSYGVVLLELLTGRKPVDMSQPAGQENLVAWTKPLLTSKEGLESIIDPSLGSEVPFESVAKVAAIASMCVQPEVSHRPFMGEVVQALKLVCNECDDSKDGGSRSHSHENLSGDFDAKDSSPVARPHDTLPGEVSLPNYAARNDVETGLSVSEIFGASATLGRQASDSFRRHSASGPLRTPKGRQFWQRMRKQSHESESEHGTMYRLWAGSH